MKVTNDIFYIGANDHKIDLFEGQYIVPKGMAYNSYVIVDEKICVMDTIEKHFTDEWLKNLKNVLGEKKPDFLIVQHMEPDHSASINAFMKAYPQTTVVASKQAFIMMKNFYGIDFSTNNLFVGEGSTLTLGKHTLHFVTAPMVHWPEVIMTYDDFDKVLFSADGFGKFGANDIEDEWDCEARRYYFGIVGKYGMQVQSVLKKASTLDIQKICPLHGPVLTDNLSHYISQYDLWSKYGVEKEGVFIAYTSVYGHTKDAVLKLAEILKENGCKKVVVSDLARSDMAENVEDAFAYGKIVLATTTYNMDIFPFMKEFINHLVERNYQNKTIAIIENGSWAPNAMKVMKTMLTPCKNITYTENNVTITSCMNDLTIAKLNDLAKELCK